MLLETDKGLEIIEWGKMHLDFLLLKKTTNMFSLITNYFILSSILKQLKTIQIFVLKLSRQFLEH